MALSCQGVATLKIYAVIYKLRTMEIKNCRTKSENKFLKKINFSCHPAIPGYFRLS